MNKQEMNRDVFCDKNDIMQTALEFIRQHCGQDITLNDAARSVWLSPPISAACFRRAWA